MKYWYIVDERAHFDGKNIGKPISAEVVDVVPRSGSGDYEWHDTERVEDGVYICRRWKKTKKDAAEEIRFWMNGAGK